MDYPKSVPNVGLVDGQFADENPATGQVGSLIPSAWGNAVTQELLNVIKAAGFVPAEGQTNQLLKAIQGLVSQGIKNSVRVATTGAIALSGVQTIDAIVLVAGDRVLVKNQASGAQNGIYVVAAGAWVRALDADESVEVKPGMLVGVDAGTVNGGSVWRLSNTAPPTLGATALTFQQVFGRTGIAEGDYGKVTVDAFGRVVGGSNPTTLAGYGITDAQAFAQILADFVTNKGWGLGQNTPSLVTDANTAIYPGFYSAGGLGATNFGDAYSPLMVMRRQSGNIIGQLQINARDNVLMFRGSADNGATWTPWVSTWHSGNLFKTISPTDTTPGAMLKVADHGIGGQCVSAETNLDLYTSGGKYITPSSGIVGLPAGWAQGRHTLEVCGGTAYREQRLTGVGANSGRSAFRTWSGTAYSPWKEYFHTGNFDPVNQLAPDAMGGFTLSYSGTVDLVVSPGRARDAADTTDIVLTAAVTRRLQAAGSWLSGSPASGLFSGVKAPSTWYHIFAVKNPSTGAVDVGFDTSVIAANRPADYTAYRRLGSFRTDASGNVVPFVMTLQSGGARYFRWVTPIMEALDATLTTAAVSLTLSVPPGVSVNAELNAWIYSNNILAYFSPLDTADLALSSVSSGGSQTGFTGGYGSITGDGIDSLGFKVDVQTDTASRIRARCNLAAGKYSLMTLGWTE
ncbi:hypothetical protein QEP73_15445 [Pseudomonas defluvii]|nr:hypothetical protein QEP73_15445 [Pseudomonas defluvii]